MGRYIRTQNAESAPSLCFPVPSCSPFYEHPGGKEISCPFCVQVAPGLAYGSLLLPILDENPYLSDGNKQVTPLKPLPLASCM